MDEDAGQPRSQDKETINAMRMSVMTGPALVPQMCLIKRSQFVDKGVPIIYGEFNRIPHVAITIDTGAGLTFVSETFLKHRKGFELIRLSPSDPKEAAGFEGSRSKLRGKVRITISVRGHTFTHMALVAANMVDPVIVGSDMLRKYNIAVDYATQTLRAAKGPSIPFQLERGSQDVANEPHRTMRSTRCLCIQPQVQQTVHIPVSAVEGSDILFQPNRSSMKWEEQGLLLPAAIATVRNGSIAIPVLSTGLKTVKLPRHANLGLYEVLDQSTSVQGFSMPPSQLKDLLEHLKHHAGKLPPMSREEECHVNPELSAIETHLLHTLLRLFRIYFRTTSGP